MPFRDYSHFGLRPLLRFETRSIKMVKGVSQVKDVLSGGDERDEVVARRMKHCSSDRAIARLFFSALPLQHRYLLPTSSS
jgi:hypothetical protein